MVNRLTFSFLKSNQKLSRQFCRICIVKLNLLLQMHVLCLTLNTFRWKVCNYRYAFISWTYLPCPCLQYKYLTKTALPGTLWTSHLKCINGFPNRQTNRQAQVEKKLKLRWAKYSCCQNEVLQMFVLMTIRNC